MKPLFKIYLCLFASLYFQFLLRLSFRYKRHDSMSHIIRKCRIHYNLTISASDTISRHHLHPRLVDLCHPFSTRSHFHRLHSTCSTQGELLGIDGEARNAFLIRIITSKN